MDINGGVQLLRNREMLSQAKSDSKIFDYIVNSKDTIKFLNFCINKFFGSGVDFGEYLGLAYEGFHMALLNYDPVNYDVEFVTYATSMIEGNFRRHVRDYDYNYNGVKTSRFIKDFYGWLHLHRREGFLEDSTKEEKIEAIKEFSGDGASRPKDVDRFIKVFLHYVNTFNSSVSFDEVYSKDFMGGDSCRPFYNIVGQHEDGYDEVDLKLSIKDLFSRIKNKNTRRKFEVLFFKGLLGGYSQHELGVELGISKGHVSRVMTKLKNYIKEHYYFCEEKRYIVRTYLDTGIKNMLVESIRALIKNSGGVLPTVRDIKKYILENNEDVDGLHEKINSLAPHYFYDYRARVRKEFEKSGVTIIGSQQTNTKKDGFEVYKPRMVRTRMPESNIKQVSDEDLVAMMREGKIHVSSLPNTTTVSEPSASITEKLISIEGVYSKESLKSVFEGLSLLLNSLPDDPVKINFEVFKV